MLMQSERSTSAIEPIKTSYGRKNKILLTR